jgi:tetratricopeptide (TPR) repeat protein
MLRALVLVIIALVIIGAGTVFYLGPSRLAELAESGPSGEDGSETAEPKSPIPAPAAHAAQEPLFDNLGTLSWPISTKVKLAQDYFDQGIRWTYAFNHSAARRAFREAQRQDPDCAMCYWGEAYVLGPNINAAMDADANEPALASLKKAQQAASNASPRERAIIDALSQRYSADPGADRAMLNKRYAEAMAKAHGAYPEDENLAVLNVEAVMTTTPWDYWEADGKTPKGDVGEAIALAEKVLAANPGHAGAIHLYIHLTEASKTPELAVPYAERLANLMPGAGHIVHMGAHTFYRIGRFQDSVELNKKAVDADDLYFAKIDDKGSLWRRGYHVHNIHFVVVSAFMTGDKATALEYAERLQDAVSDDVARDVGWVQLIKQAPYLVNAHLSDPETVLQIEDPGNAFPFVKSMWHYARGVAFARSNRISQAQAEAAKIAQLEQRKDVAYPEDIQPVVNGVLQIAQRVIEGRIAEAQGDWQGAAKAYRGAAEIQDTLPYLEPPYWYYPVRQTLGAALLRAGDAAQAREVFQATLERAPNNGWALFGLMQAQKALGDEASAAETQQQLEAAWSGDTASLDLSQL